jgi:hypothetical protein
MQRRSGLIARVAIAAALLVGAISGALVLDPALRAFDSTAGGLDRAASATRVIDAVAPESAALRQAGQTNRSEGGLLLAALAVVVAAASWRPRRYDAGAHHASPALALCRSTISLRGPPSIQFGN